MIKSILKLSIFCTLLATTSLQAQISTGKFHFSAGIGLVPNFVTDDAEVNTPPISLRAGYQITPAIGLSAFAGYASSTSSSPFIISDGQYTLVNNKQMLFGLRGEIRKDLADKFDIYGGGMLGYNYTNAREFDPVTDEKFFREINGPTPFDPDEKEGEFLYSGFVGGTYYFNKSVGLFAEAGYGVSLLSTGITVRL